MMFTKFMKLPIPLGRLSDIGQARGASNNEVPSTKECKTSKDPEP